MFVVYVLRSQSSGKIYIGQTDDLVQRVKRHNGLLPVRGRSYTKLNKGPWGVVYKEEFATRGEAIVREKQLKSFQGRQFIKKLLGSLAR